MKVENSLNLQSWAKYPTQTLLLEITMSFVNLYKMYFYISSRILQHSGVKINTLTAVQKVPAHNSRTIVVWRHFNILSDVIFERRDTVTRVIIQGCSNDILSP